MKFVQPLWTVVCQFFKKFKYLHKRIEHICPHRDIVVQLPSHVQLFVTPWTAAHQASLFHLPKFAQVHVHCIGDAIQPSHPLRPSSPSALNLSQHQGLFFSESAICIRWLKYWRFSFSISITVLPMSILGWYPLRLTGLISLLSRGLRSLFQHCSLKTSIIRFSAFFKVLLSQPYGPLSWL